MTIDSPPRAGRRLSRPRPPAQRTGGRRSPHPRTAAAAGRRNPKWIALGVVAICLGGLLSYVIYSRVATESAVVAIAATVYRGEVIEAGDLTTITLSGDPTCRRFPPVRPIILVGKRAAYDLVDGSLVAPSAVTSAAAFPRRSARWSG